MKVNVFTAKLSRDEGAQLVFPYYAKVDGYIDSTVLKYIEEMHQMPPVMIGSTIDEGHFGKLSYDAMVKVFVHESDRPCYYLMYHGIDALMRKMNKSTLRVYVNLKTWFGVNLLDMCQDMHDAIKQIELDMSIKLNLLEITFGIEDDSNSKSLRRSNLKDQLERSLDGYMKVNVYEDMMLN